MRTKEKGKVIHLSEVKNGKTQRGYDWANQTIVIEVTENESCRKVAVSADLEAINDMRQKGIKIGDIIEFSYQVFAREWQGRWFNNVELMSMEMMSAAIGGAGNMTDKNDDLPF